MPIRNLVEGSKILLIFHWDTDGVASAALLKKYLGHKTKLYTPLIGLYTLKYVRSSICKDVDNVLIVDFGVSNDDVKRFISKCSRNTLIIDHHHRRQDPDLNIIPYFIDSEPYPATSLLISDNLNIEYNLLSIIGIVGDYGEAIYNSKYMELVEDVGRKYDMDIEELIMLSNLIDSNYMSGDRRKVVKAVDILIKYFDKPRELLNYTPWIRQCNDIMKEIDKYTHVPPKKVGSNIYFLEINSKYLITSSIGRSLARRYRGSYIIVGSPSLHRNYSQIYVRIHGDNKINLSTIVDKLVEKGFYAGGKPNVFGVIVPKRKYNYLIQWIINELKGRYSY